MKNLFLFIALCLFPTLMMAQTQETTMSIEKIAAFAVVKTYEAPEDIVIEVFKNHISNCDGKLKRKGNYYLAEKVVLKDISTKPYDLYMEISSEKGIKNKTTAKATLSTGYLHFMDASSTAEMAGVTKLLNDMTSSVIRERNLSELSVQENKLKEHNEKLQSLEKERTGIETEIATKQQEIDEANKVIESLKSSL